MKVAQLAQEGNAEFENIINNFRDEFTQMEPSNEQSGGDITNLLL